MPGTDDRTEDVDVATVRAVLGDPGRLHVLRAVYEAGEAMSVRELARELEASPGEPVAVHGLHHRHLPALDQAGWVAYDAKTRVVEPADTADVRDALSNVSNHLDAVAAALDER